MRNTAITLSMTLVGLAFAVPTAASQGFVKLAPSDGVVGAWFGRSVFLDGNVALVGADGDFNNGQQSGAAYLFDARSGQQLLKMTPSDGESGMLFGHSVSLDGNLVLVGSLLGRDGTGTVPGSAYLFDATNGLELFKLLPSNPGSYGEFGRSVALQGGLALVGAPMYLGNGTGCGAAYLFDAATGQELLEFFPSNGVQCDAFGTSVSLEGNLALVGAPHICSSTAAKGSAYIFDVTTGQELFHLEASDGVADARFGYSVSLHGGLALVGAHFDDAHGQDSGSAYLFDATTGQELMKITPSDGHAYHNFGTSVSLGDGFAVIGADADSDVAPAAGAAYLFDSASGRQIAKFVASDGGPTDRLGCSVAVDGGLVLAGAVWDDDNGPNSGTAYVFEFPEPGTGYCFGDPGSGTPCPCGNNNNGAMGGCDWGNPAFPEGGVLEGLGTNSMAANDAFLVATGIEDDFGIFFGANNQVNGGDGNPLNDGLRCAGGGLLRLTPPTVASGNRLTLPAPIQTLDTGAASGVTRRYQYWFRTPGGPCGQMANLTNGYEIVWLP